MAAGVPADGVLSEHCRVDEALLCGESAPLTKRRGDALIAGSVVVDGRRQMRVERVGADTAWRASSRWWTRARARSRGSRAPANARRRSFVARVLVLAALTAVGWASSIPRAFSAAVAVLVVACPCAFALAVPAAVTRALAVLARRGVLVVRPDAIEDLAGATHVMFDKTGTLTEPELALADVQTFDGVSREAALRLAAALARESRHPVARAIAAARGRSRGRAGAPM